MRRSWRSWWKQELLQGVGMAGAVLKVVQESSRVSCEAPFPHWGDI